MKSSILRLTDQKERKIPPLVPAKNLCRRPRFLPWVGKILWRREWLSTPVILPRESHGQRSLKSYSLWGGKESNMTKGLTHNTDHMKRNIIGNYNHRHSELNILAMYNTYGYKYIYRC